MNSTIDIETLKPLININDPRAKHKIRHNLQDILILTICAVISGANTWDEIEEWANTQYDWLKKYLELPNGIPSHDTLNRVFSLINEKELEKTFIQWASNMKVKYDLEVIAIDGKTIRGSKNTNEIKSKIHLVSAWACENDLVLGQVKVLEKSNEITAIPELLNLLNIENTIVTIDAMGTQKKIAQKIVDLKADYILSLKKNHKNLYEDISYYFEEELKGASNSFNSYKTQEKSHGRLETRECYVCNDINWLENKEEWANFKTIIMIKSQREINGKCSSETRFYISSLNKSAEIHLNSIRKHWKIENSKPY